MSSRPLKSTARLWDQAPGPAQRYRDRKRVTLPNGEKRDVVGYGPTKAAATSDLYSKVAQLEAKARAAIQPMTVTQVMARLMQYKRNVKSRKAKTLFNDLDLFKRHIRPYIGAKPITDVTLDDLEAIQARLTRAGKWRTAELVTIQLKSLYKHALRHYRADIRAGKVHLFDLTEDLEQVQRPAGAKRTPGQAWTVDQLKAFLAEAKAAYDSSKSNLRRGELLGLRRSSLVETPAGAYLAIREQLVYYDGKHHWDTPKSQSGVRDVPIGPELVDVLKAHMAKLDKVAAENPNWRETDLLFPSYNGLPLEPGNLYRAQARIVEKLGLPRARLHDLRALYATYVTKELVRQARYSPKIVQHVLGHSHPGVALEHYNRVVGEDLAAAVFDPVPGGSLDISLDKSGKEKDATSAEVAS
jgi:integrase